MAVKHSYRVEFSLVVIGDLSETYIAITFLDSCYVEYAFVQHKVFVESTIFMKQSDYCSGFSMHVVLYAAINFFHLCEVSIQIYASIP